MRSATQSSSASRSRTETSFIFYRAGLDFDPIGDHEVAEHGQSECILDLSTETDAAVDEVVDRAHQAGAEIVIKPGQHWGYAGAFADPDSHFWQVVVKS